MSRRYQTSISNTKPHYAALISPALHIISIPASGITKGFSSAGMPRWLVAKAQNGAAASARDGGPRAWDFHQGTREVSSNMAGRKMDHLSIPDAPCMEYLPTFTLKMTQM